MSQYSLFVDGNTNPNNTLLVREAGCAVRLAQRAEILAVARDLVMIDELRGENLSSPDKAMASCGCDWRGWSTRSAGSCYWTTAFISSRTWSRFAAR